MGGGGGEGGDGPRWVTAGAGRVVCLAAGVGGAETPEGLVLGVSRARWKLVLPGRPGRLFSVWFPVCEGGRGTAQPGPWSGGTAECLDRARVTPAEVRPGDRRPEPQPGSPHLALSVPFGCVSPAGWAGRRPERNPGGQNVFHQDHSPARCSDPGAHGECTREGQAVPSVLLRPPCPQPGSPCATTSLARHPESRAISCPVVSVSGSSVGAGPAASPHRRLERLVGAPEGLLNE